jgi:hypothetical protein
VTCRVASDEPIEHAEVELRALNVLIGANGAGKSNFVGVFELLREVVEGRLQVYVARRGGADTLLRFGRAHTPALVIESGLHGYQERSPRNHSDPLAVPALRWLAHAPRSARPLTAGAVSPPAP